MVARSVVYRWTGGAGGLNPSAMRMRTMNHKPINHPKGNPQDGGGQYGACFLNVDIRA